MRLNGELFAEIVLRVVSIGKKKDNYWLFWPFAMMPLQAYPSVYLFPEVLYRQMPLRFSFFKRLVDKKGPICWTREKT